MSARFLRVLPCLGVSAMAALFAETSDAAEIKRANSSGALNNTARWVGGVLPGPSDIAVWDSTITTAANCTNGLGASTAWLGIKILNPSATAQVSFTSGAVLALGASGINLADPGTTRDLAFNSSFDCTNGMDWNVKGGRFFSYSRQVDIINNATISITNGGVITGNGGANCIIRIGAGTTGTATMNQSAGTNIFNQSGGVVVLHIGKATGNIGVYNLTGGVMDADDVAGSIIGLADVTGTEGHFNVSGGTVFANVVHVGRSGTGILTLSGTGTMILTGNMNVPNGAVGAGIVNFDGGTLTVPQITQAAGVGTFNFNGGDLKLAASQGDFLHLLTVNVKEGGARIDTVGFDATILQPLLHGGVAPIDGGLIKSGAGTLTLRGADTYSGNNLVSGGKLVISTAHTGTGSITISDGAAFGATVAAPGTSLSTTSLILSSSTGATSEFNLGSFGNPTAPILYATNLETHGTVVVNVSGVGLSVGQFPLIKYSGSIAGSGFGAFALGTLPPGVTANLVNNSGNSSVDLNVTVAPLLLWTAAQTSDWDILTTTNWVDLSTSTGTSFMDGYPVLFTDGAASGNVNIVAPVSPGSTTVSNNALAYVFGGPSQIVSGPLRKEGPGSLTLSNSLAHTGDTTINGGSLNYGISEAIPNGAGKGNVIVNGTLNLSGFNGTINGLSGNGIVDNTTGASTLTVGGNNAPISFAGVIQNSGGTLALTKTGSGILTLSGNNSYTGDTTLSAGPIQVGHNNAFGASLVHYNAGTMSSDSLSARNIPNTVIIGANITLGSTVNSGVLNFSGGISFIATARTLTLSSDAIFSGPLSNGSIIKSGPATLTLTGPADWTLDSEVRVGNMILNGAFVTNSLDVRVDASQLNGNPRLILTNGAVLVLNSATANFRAGFDGTDTSTNFLDVAGLVRMPNAPAGKVILGPAVKRGVLNLFSGGDVEADSVVPADMNIVAGGSQSEVNFDGGTLRPKASTTTFMQNLTDVNIRNGGAVIDTSGFDIAIAQQLQAGGSGGLTKNGLGALTLTGTNTYTGASVVNVGKLIVTPAHAGGGAFTLNDGAALQVKLISAGTTLNASTVTLGSSTGAAMEFNLAALGNPTAPIVNTTSLATHGSVTVNVSGANLSAGQFVLMKYSGAIGGSGYPAFTLGSLPLGVTANLVNNVGNSSVDLLITAVVPVSWTGSINGDWDIGGTANWTVGVSPTTYLEPAVPGPAVRFDDSAPGTRTVNITTVVSPASIVVSNTSPDYSFGGGGKISGPASLTKQGSGNLTMGSFNDYTGGTVVSAGKLILAGSDVIPDGAGKGGLTVNGTFDLAGSSDTVNGLSGNGTVDASVGASVLTVGSNSTSSTFSGTIINSGGTLALTKVGTGTVVLTGNNGYSAGTTILAGSMQVGSGTALGSGQVTLSSGNVSSDSTTARSLNNPFLITIASSFGNATNNGLLTLNGSIDFNAANRIVTYNSDVTSTGTLGNGSQHKEGTATFTMTGTANFTSDCEIRRGTWILDGGIVTNTGAFRPDTTLSPGFARVVVTNGGAVFLTGTAVNGRVGYTGGDNTSTNVFDLAGLFRMPNADSANGLFTVGRSGNRGILNTYVGADILTRQLLRSTTGTGQYGEVNFDGGILRAMNDQASFITGLDLVRIRNGGVTIDDSGFVIGIPQPLLSDGGSGGLTKIGTGTMQLNGTNTYTGTTLVSAGALGGNGIIAGPVSVASGAALSPGASVGKLTINNTLALSSGSTTFIELDKGALTNDIVTGLTSVTYGGTLSVTNLSGTLVVGDSFQIFSSGAYGGLFSAVTPSTPGPGLAWNTSQLAVNGTLSIDVGVATNPTNITMLVSGGVLDLSWPADHTGWRLESQTNAPGVGLTTNWSTVTGSASTNQMQFPIGVGSGSVFFRLVYP